MNNPIDASGPLATQISEILREVHDQAPEVLELGVAKVRSTAELQVGFMVFQWLLFLLAIGLMSCVWKSWRVKHAAYKAWRDGSRDERSSSSQPDDTTEAHDVWAVIAGCASGALLFVIVIQIG